MFIKKEEDYLLEIKNKRNKNTFTILVEGSFDLGHFGHVNVFNQIINNKKYKEKIRKDHNLSEDEEINYILIAGVSSDYEIIKNKAFVIMNGFERYNNIINYKNVNYVYYNVPWIISKEYMDKYYIDYIAHDGNPYNLKVKFNNSDELRENLKFEKGILFLKMKDEENYLEVKSIDYFLNEVIVNDTYELIKKENRFLETYRTYGVSTGTILNQVLYNTAIYLYRNLILDGKEIKNVLLGGDFMKKELIEYLLKIGEKINKEINKDLKIINKEESFIISYEDYINSKNYEKIIKINNYKYLEDSFNEMKEDSLGGIYKKNKEELYEKIIDKVKEVF